MKRSNVMAALVTMGLTAAAVTPALALENEFHGLFSARFINSNFNGTETTSYTYQPEGKAKAQHMASFIEQRARLQYIAKANADLKLVTHFELDYSYWGNSSYAVGRNQGGALGADTINLETKSIYVDANPFKNINMKVGMQPANDSFKGLLFDADMAGIQLSSTYHKFSPTVGFFRFNDAGPRYGVNDVKAFGDLTNDLFMLDGKYEISNDFKVGGAYYFFRDNTGTNNVSMNVLGVNAEYGHGPLSLNGFAIYETGWNNNRYTNAFAGNVGAKLKTGPGTARAEVLYVSGDSGSTGRSHSFYSVDFEHGYYDNEMVILGRDKNAYTTDNSIIFNAGNSGRGQIGGYFGYDLPVNDRLTTACNIGFAAVAHDTSSSHESKYLGTEINAEANYKLIEGLTASFRAGYVVLGDYYKNVAINGTPDNPFDTKLILKYAF